MIDLNFSSTSVRLFISVFYISLFSYERFKISIETTVIKRFIHSK